MTKVCRGCGEEKEIDDFYNHSEMADGHLNYCKECVKERVLIHRVENIDKVRKYDRERGKNPDRIAKNAAETKKRRIEVMGYGRGHSAIARAIRNGSLQRSNTCQVCAKQGKTEAHHSDYDKAMNVVWLCPACHKTYHMGKSKAADRVRMIVDLLLQSIGCSDSKII